MATGRIGLIFVVPGQRETLRVNGTASLNNDPALLEQLSARGKPTLLCTEVGVDDTSSPDLERAWHDWFTLRSDHFVDPGNPFGPAREITPSAATDLPADSTPAAG